ncbi:uncharacterized protein EAF02_006961 [Botrytis sinoallii]|uniref:uncharacterized protein n=1 Tax=Botrytis sinoallii TaxID=1463999 RepID=UPI0018FF4F3B|nr:uncharacterized protein EAF02_006961 [Botrytis sinoallii]KAF7881070.1 hypothetical protein EAF02_006961 [Botrytis sinoallii]
MASTSGVKPTLVDLLQTPISQSLPADIVELILSQPMFLQIPRLHRRGWENSICKDVWGGDFKRVKNGIRKVFKKVGDIKGGNILFHCTAGKDRTGVVAALMLAFFGASEEEIALDYALTRIGTGPHREKLLQEMLKWVGEEGLEQPGLDDLSSVKGENIIAFLNWMDAEWGSDVERNVNCSEHVEGRR